MHSSERPLVPISGGFGFPFGFVLAVIATLVAVSTGATAHPLISVFALAVATALVAGVSTLRAALATAATCWALHTGFVLGRHGDLALTPRSGRDAIALCLVAVVVFALAAAVRAARAAYGQARPVAARIPAPRRAHAPAARASSVH